MTPTQLQDYINRLGVVRCGSALVGRCPNCQPEEESVDAFKLQVRAGDSYPIIVFCVRCGISKPQNGEERRFNRQLSRSIFAAAGVDLDAVFQKLEPEQIRELWSSVVVEGGVPNSNDDGRADDDALHLTYSTLLDRLSLSDRHRRWLDRRGLPSDYAFSIGYRSTGSEQLWADRHTEGVPGLVNRRWLVRPDSILIPCRNRQHLICAVKQRLFGERSRMRLVSHSDCKAAHILHWPVGSSLAKGQSLWLVEGERKGDVSVHQFGQSVVSLPGTGMWSRCVGLAAEAGSVVLAMDADDAGRQCCGRLGRTLTEMGVGVSICRWSEGKGIDDAIRLKAKIEMVEWEDVAEEYGEEQTIPTPQLKSPDPQKPLKDHQVLDWIRQHQPVLRSKINAFQPYISQLIREGLIEMVKTQEGQLLKVRM